MDSLDSFQPFFNDILGQCDDIHDTVQCRAWAIIGECAKNPAYMTPNCRRSCEKCDD